MTFSSWISRRWTTNRPLLRHRPALRCRPLLEALEDRTVPTVSFDSAFSVGHDLGSSQAWDVATDVVGNSYMTGDFTGTTDFDPAHTYPGDTDILIARGSADAFVAKYAPDNSLLWVARMGGDTVSPARTDIGKALAIDGSGNVHVSGEFLGSADFGATTLVSTDGGRDGFVAKLNADGLFLWAKRSGGTGEDASRGVGVDAIGNVYAVTTSAGSSTTNADNSVKVLKFNATGGAVWIQSITTRGLSLWGQLAVDGAGSVYVGSDFHGTVDFDPSNKTHYVSSSVSYTSYSGFVLKLTTAGKFAWVSPFVGQGSAASYGTSFINSIALDGTGNVIVGGNYSGPVDFKPGSGTTILPSTGRAYVTKLNASGGLVWAKALESDNTITVYGLDVDAAGSIYATGYFRGTVDFDPGAGTSLRTTAGGADVFVMKMDAAGNFGWTESFGAAGDDLGFEIAVDTSGTIHLAGAYHGTVDFDPDPINTYWLTNPGTYYNIFHVLLRQS